MYRRGSNKSEGEGKKLSEFNPWSFGTAAVTVAIALMPSTTGYCESSNINTDEIMMKQTSSRHSDLYLSVSKINYPEPVDLTQKSSYFPQDQSIKESGREYTIQNDNMTARFTGLNSEAIPVYSEDGQRASNEFNAKIMLRGRYSGELELPPLELDESETFEIELNNDFPVVNRVLGKVKFKGELELPPLELD
jgi:hypothetical protein